MPKTDHSQKINTAPTSDEMRGNDIFSVSNNISDQLEIMEKFISRRFDEISMEINATSMQIDISEEGITKRFSEILEVLHAISFKGDGNTPANAGVELDAVVKMTEDAATRILDAADRIAGCIHESQKWDSEKDRKKSLEKIDNDIQEIFMACEFQDITGQRIRNTLENLKAIEDRLGTALDKMGVKIDHEDIQNASTEEASTESGASQDEIDDLFD